jgi:hypothetical protein
MWQEAKRSVVNSDTLNGDIQVVIKFVRGAGHRNKGNHLNEHSERREKRNYSKTCS